MKQIETQTLRDEVRRVFASEQQALAQVSVQVEESIALVAGVIAEAKGKVVVTGLGKSGLVGHKIAATLASTGTPAVFMNAAEALHGDLGMVSRQDVVLMISNSGSTVELTQMLPSLRKKGATIVGIFGNPGIPPGTALCTCHQHAYLA